MSVCVREVPFWIAHGSGAVCTLQKLPPKSSNQVCPRNALGLISLAGSLLGGAGSDQFQLGFNSYPTNSEMESYLKRQQNGV